MLWYQGCHGMQLSLRFFNLSKRRDIISIFKTPDHAGDYLEPLTFHIIDSPMGSGKSSALIRSIRMSRLFRQGTNQRFIVFVSSIKERDERFLQQLNAKQPPTEPYCKSILGLIARGDNIVTTQSLYNIFNNETIEAFHKSN